MSLDLKVFTATTSGSLAAATWPRADYVDGSYSLIQRIAKCLYTLPGSDAFDPTFGVDLVSAFQGLSPTDTEQATEAAASLARDVTAQIRPIFASSNDPAQRLISISVAAVTFNMGQLSWDVELVVQTEARTISVTV